MKNIWIFNHYATNQFFSHGGRHYSFAKFLMRAGYKVTIFCASTVHNTDKNLILDGRPFQEDNCEGIPFVFIRTRSYKGNGKSRILNMLDYYRGLLVAIKQFDRPDIIIGSSVHPLACVSAIKLSKKYRCKNIVEIRDLWPESIVAYGIKSRKNLIVKALYNLEKWIYSKAEAIIFTIEGGRDYIIEKGWDKDHGGPVDLNKVHHINNGVDFEEFNYNKEHYTFPDPVLDDPDTFKVVYTGSIRSANRSILVLPEVAKEISRRGRNDIKILVYGKGDYIDTLIRESSEKQINNLIYKGYVEKKSIPYILSKSNLNILNCDSSDMSKYGSSQNKLFEYLASGKPILSGEDDQYSIVRNRECGISKHFESAEEIARSIIYLSENQIDNEHIRSVGAEYDFSLLTRKLLRIIEDE